MFETFGFEETTAREVSVLFALALGVVFGTLAHWTRFCFRRAVVGDDRKQAAGVWLLALAAAITGTQAATTLGWLDLSNHRLLGANIPVLGLIVGGLLFGVGMVLTRGCISRLTVLSGGGNLRALTCILVFAVVAHATLKGVLAPLRTTLTSWSFETDLVSLPPLVGLIGAAIAVLIALRSGNRPLVLFGAVVIGLLVPFGWVGTGYVLFDEFDPIAVQSLGFIGPSADALFFTIASTSIPAGFGVGLIGGVLVGGLLGALTSGQFRWQSFESPAQTGRYVFGAVLMGFGGAVAGGCTVGAGLAGLPTLGVASLLIMGSITVGALITSRAISATSSGSAEQPARPALRPAE
ncbi:MAG: YeeE/YedE family protein [Rhodobacteraceae bacterium]|nr:YeeE/YedE family protein [Paracoccaceae bacterium]